MGPTQFLETWSVPYFHVPRFSKRGLSPISQGRTPFFETWSVPVFPKKMPAIAAGLRVLLHLQMGAEENRARLLNLYFTLVRPHCAIMTHQEEYIS